MLRNSLFILSLLLFCISLTMIGCSGEKVELGNGIDNMKKPAMENPITPTDLSPVARTAADIRNDIEQSPYLDGVHWSNGLVCDYCHKQQETSGETAPASVICMDCHGGYETLGKELMSREEYQDYNPHASPHGNEGCLSCHHVHQYSELTCSICHSLGRPNGFQ